MQTALIRVQLPFRGITDVDLRTRYGNFFFKVWPWYMPAVSAETKKCLEKGGGPWSAARGPVLKKLKRSPARSSGSRLPTASAASQGLLTLDSASSPESDSASESDEDSNSLSGSEEEIEPEEQSPLPLSRPTDLTKATEYDALKAVWAPRNRILSVAAIRAALGDYWALIKGIRDKWKTDLTALQQAELKPDQGKIAQLARSVNEQRRLMESCIRLTLIHGHQDIIEK